MHDTPAAREESSRYEIRVQGHLEPRWAVKFDGMNLTTHDDGTTSLTGLVIDQAALHGLLAQLRDIGIPLVSVTPSGAASPTVAARPTPTSPDPAPTTSTGD
jgi:hypothetical protein